MKLCIRKCSSKPLPLSAFYAAPKMTDGHAGICKECHKREMRERRDANLEKARAYDRDRWNNNPQRRRYIEETSAEHRLANPQKYKARTALNNAVRDGRIEKLPCEKCGDPKSQGHHHDYSKPLDVEWLCVDCHFALHREENRMEHVSGPLERVLQGLVRKPEAAE